MRRAPSFWRARRCLRKRSSATARGVKPSGQCKCSSGRSRRNLFSAGRCTRYKPSPHSAASSSASCPICSKMARSAPLDAATTLDARPRTRPSFGRIAASISGATMLDCGSSKEATRRCRCSRRPSRCRCSSSSSAPGQSSGSLPSASSGATRSRSSSCSSALESIKVCRQRGRRREA